MNNEVSIKSSIELLEDLFKKFNERFYNGELQNVIITISPDDGTQAYGWITTWKAWKHKDSEDGYYEITLGAEYLNRPLEETCGTLLHEMAHLYNLQHGIKDCSRGNKYHNKKFLEVATTHGLLVSKSEKYGYSHTQLNNDALEFIKELDVKGFELHREDLVVVKQSKKSNSIKYVCPMCNMTVRATKKVNVTCSDCNVEMECEE